MGSTCFTQAGIPGIVLLPLVLFFARSDWMPCDWRFGPCGLTLQLGSRNYEPPELLAVLITALEAKIMDMLRTTHNTRS